MIYTILIFLFFQISSNLKSQKDTITWPSGRMIHYCQFCVTSPLGFTIIVAQYWFYSLIEKNVKVFTFKTLPSKDVIYFRH